MEKSAIQAVEFMKSCPFGLTGIKIEFEAVFQREASRRICLGEECTERVCENCDDGRITYPECDGTERIECPDCQGRGWRRRLSDGEHVNHRACNGTGQIQCPQEGCYEGDGTLECPECHGQVEITCESVHIHPNDMASFNDYVLSKLEPLGLAERLETGSMYAPQGRILSYKYKPSGALRYSKFYVDMSVDTEWTMTLDVRDALVVAHLPEIVRIFTSIGDILGHGTSSRGAGLHIALLNSENAVYPTSNTQNEYFTNFRKSMRLLMPALFFMASCDERSRSLHFRRPSAESDAQGVKYWAINYARGALEFRVFETCYERPEAIFEYITTIAKCMQYWTLQFKPTGLRKIVKRCKFGNDENTSLERFYVKEKHVKLLDAGLEILRPKIMSIKQLKELRNFTVTEETIKRKDTEYVEDVERRYREYASRIGYYGGRIAPIDSYRSAYMSHLSTKEGDYTIEEGEA